MANLTSTILERKKVTQLTWVPDDGCAGLRARLSIDRGNRKVAFYYRYRDRITSKRKIVKVGDYPAMSIADARNKINTELRPIADAGVDVRTEAKRRERSQSTHADNTIAGLMPDYLEFCELAGVSKGTIANYQRYLLPLKFWWGEKHPSELTRADAQAVFFKVQKRGGLNRDGESTGRGGDRAAGLVHSSSRAYYSWLLDKEVVESNPWMGQKRMKVGESRVSGSVLNDDAISMALGTMAGRDAAVFRLLLATGLRPHNVCEARWTEIKNDLWTIPATQMKWKKGPDHVIYLSDYAKAVLADLRKSQRGRPRYVFPSEGATGHLNVDTLRWDGFSPKVCRATVRTLLQSIGCPFEERSRITHHSHQTKLQRAYDKHLYKDEVMDWWQRLGKHLAALEPD